MEAVRVTEKGKHVAVLGGDVRQAHLAEVLAEKNSGFVVSAIFMEKTAKLSAKVRKTNDLRKALPSCGTVIFPLPLLGTDGRLNAPQSDAGPELGDCLAHVSPEANVFAGMVPEGARRFAEERGVELIDYFTREEFAILNAIPTSEGAVEIALRERPVTLFGSTCLVLGYGRIAKALSRLLKGFGARVRVAARKQGDLAWAKLNGCEPVPICELDDHLRDVDCVFNTVPALLLGEEKLKRLGRQCLVIDLASKPGGVDFRAAKSLGLKAIHALSLPGSSAPHTAGEIILSTIFNILNERGTMCG
jgi:dipicolinate synthase subunit A